MASNFNKVSEFTVYIVSVSICVWRTRTNTPSRRQCLKEKWDSRVGQRNLSFPNFWYGSPHLHCIGGEDEGTERRGSTSWCGWDGKMNIEDNCGSQWVCRTQK